MDVCRLWLLCVVK